MSPHPLTEADQDALTTEIMDMIPADRMDLLLHLAVMRAKAIGMDAMAKDRKAEA